MSDGLTIQTGQWQDAVRSFMQVTRRELPDVLNRSAGSVAIKAYMNTRVASRKKIKAELKSGRQMFAVAKQYKKKTKLKLTNQFSPVLFGIVKKSSPDLSGARLLEEVKRIYYKRQAAVFYVAHGWVPAIRGFGRSAPRSRGFLMTHPSGSFAKAIQSDVPVAVLENSAATATKNAGPALQQALKQEAAQLRIETQKRLERYGPRNG